MESIRDEIPPYLQEGTDAVVFLFSSSSKEDYQEKYKVEFIDCKTRFKRLRNRSVRFYSVDLNTDSKLPYLSAAKFPAMMLFPAYNKEKSQFVFESALDSIVMAKWIHKHADIKFDLREETYFKKSQAGEM